MNLGDTSTLPTVLTDTEAADLLGVSAWHLGELARRGEAPIEPLTMGRRRLWPTARLLDLLGIPVRDGGRGHHPSSSVSQPFGDQPVQHERGGRE